MKYLIIHLKYVKHLYGGYHKTIREFESFNEFIAYKKMFYKTASNWSDGCDSDGNYYTNDLTDAEDIQVAIGGHFRHEVLFCPGDVQEKMRNGLSRFEPILNTVRRLIDNHGELVEFYDTIDRLDK